MTRTTVKESVAKDLCRLGLHAADPGAGGSNIGMCERANTISGDGIVRGYRGIVSGILVQVEISSDRTSFDTTAKLHRKPGVLVLVRIMLTIMAFICRLCCRKAP